MQFNLSAGVLSLAVLFHRLAKLEDCDSCWYCLVLQKSWGHRHELLSIRAAGECASLIHWSVLGVRNCERLRWPMYNTVADNGG